MGRVRPRVTDLLTKFPDVHGSDWVGTMVQNIFINMHFIHDFNRLTNGVSVPIRTGFAVLFIYLYFNRCHTTRHPSLPGPRKSSAKHSSIALSFSPLPPLFSFPFLSLLAFFSSLPFLSSLFPFLPPLPSDVNKDLTCKAKAKAKDLIYKAKAKAKDLTCKAKAKAKDLTCKAKAKAKDLSFKAKAKAKDLTFKAKPRTYVARQQYWSLCFLYRFISIMWIVSFVCCTYAN